MNWAKIHLIMGMILLCFGTTAYAAENYPVAWGPSSATFGPCGISIPAGKFGIGGNIVFGEGDGARQYSKRLNGDVKSTKFNEVLKLRYGILDTLDIRLATPFYNVHLNRSNAPDHDVYGVGDTTVVLHQRLLNQGGGDPLSLALDYGVTFPTGSVSAHSSDAAGNAAWGGVVGIGATYFLYANRFDTEVNYAMFTEGGHDLQKGNRFRWNLGYAYALSNLVDLGIESTMEANDNSKRGGVRQQDASLEWYAGPKVAFKYKPWNTFAGLTVKFPLERWYHGTQGVSDDYRIEFKLIKVFDVGTFF
ncbi:MAG: transporter [Desulfovibrio sp.]|uniref:transporter n=1 Tax=Desulfovibrio sp. 7SRBS1 TaxID=3378064 RepID=UPI003B3C19F2